MEDEKNVYKDSNIEIRKNVMKFDNHIIQLSNISCVSVSKMEKKKISNEVYICILIGLILLNFNALLGILVMGVGIVGIFRVILYNGDLGYYLKMELNSGINAYFSANDDKFLYSIVEVMENCFNDTNTIIKIDMKNSNIIYGDSNSIEGQYGN